MDKIRTTVSRRHLDHVSVQILCLIALLLIFKKADIYLISYSDVCIFYNYMKQTNIHNLTHIALLFVKMLNESEKTLLSEIYLRQSMLQRY